MNKTLKQLIKMRNEVDSAFPVDAPSPEFYVSANALFAAYVAQAAIDAQLKATCRAYILLMDEVKELSARVEALTAEVKVGKGE